MKGILFLLFFFGEWNVFSQRLDTLPNLPDHYNSRLAKFKSEPVVPGKVMFVGNSITEGGNWRRLLKDSSVINRGISGDNSFGLRERLGEIVRHKPSKLFLLIGVNDLSKNIPNERVIENIFSFVSALKSASPKTEVFVQSILPVNPSVKNFPSQFNKQESIREINGQLQKYAEVFKFTFVNIHSYFSGSGDALEAKFTFDGLHLNSGGYLHWVEFLKKNGYL